VIRERHVEHDDETLGKMKITSQVRGSRRCGREHLPKDAVILLVKQAGGPGPEEEEPFRPRAAFNRVEGRPEEFGLGRGVFDREARKRARA
jgi:hypothetical protein